MRLIRDYDREGLIMTVSIIIPHLDNGTNYLQECLDSLAAQAFRDVELLVEEDDLNKPLGVAAMRNRGLKKASGDYVLFIDSDDYLGIESLSEAVYTASLNPGKIVRIPMIRTYYKYSTSVEMDNFQGSYAEKNENTRNSINKNDSCLGQLIPRDLLENLEFDEDLRYYSDLPFVAALYERAKVTVSENAKYYKRTGNDQIGRPTLSQEVNAARFGEYCRAFVMAAAGVRDTTRLSVLLCDFLVSRTVKGFNPKAAGWSDEDLISFGEVVKKLCGPVMKCYKGEEHRVLRAFYKGDIKKVRTIVKRHHRKKKWGIFFKSAHQRRLLIYNKIFRKMPVKKNVVLFSAFFGRSYCDSCRALYEYMSKHHPEYKYVWAINDKTLIPGGPVRVKTNSLRYYYYLATAGFYINNVRQPEWFVKRKDTILLETWHGTPLKKLAFDLEDVYAAKPLEYKKTFYRQACEWNYLVSDNAFSSEAFSTAFRYPKEKMLEFGYPRNDILYAENASDIASELKKKMGLPLDKKIVLYAPTWRDDEAAGVGEYGFTLKLELEKLKALSDRYHFILRTHYLISDNLRLSDMQSEYVTDLSKYGDISELYLISDMLITDYSSVFFDYANLRRPIIFYVYDFEKYRDVLHGFYFDMETGCPGPMYKTTDEVVNALQNPEGIIEEYKEKYEEFYNKFCYLDDGKASERITEFILSDKVRI